MISDIIGPTKATKQTHPDNSRARDPLFRPTDHGAAPELIPYSPTFSTLSPLVTMGIFGDTNIDWKKNRWAIFYCSISAIGALCYGYDNTYYNGVLAMQEFKNDYGTRVDENGLKALTSSFQSLTASSIYIGDLFGALLASPINDRWGRKMVFWVASICILLGGIAQVADTNHEGVIVAGRIVMGLGVGQFTVTTLLYIGEVAPSEIRGPALMMFQLSQLVASAISQGTENINSSLSYKLPMGGLIILPLMMFAGLPFIPESPTWFALKGRFAEAERSLCSIHRGQAGYDPAEELRVLEELKVAEEEHSEGSSWKALVTDPIERRKLTYAAGAMFSNQICGILFFYVYGVVFAAEIGISDPFLIQLITNILQIFAVGASVLLGNKVRRRSNLMITNFIILGSFTIIGGMGTIQPLSRPAQYVIVVFSYICIMGYNFGLGPLGYTVAREMSVGQNQNKIMSTSIVVFYFTTWAVSFTAPYMYYDGGLGPMVGFVYAGTTCLAIAWTWFCVGETSGRTNQEISYFFTEKIPVRQWRTYQFDHDRYQEGDEKLRDSEDRHAATAHVDRSA
ncbi:putative glucose transporter rco-3 [Paramyrothecium foliicola]|nr:putative glucose transporter rco-3 [Paramyrothecium foliicola]